MKLTAFRINNFRSIKDTGWHDLAYDNITCLIGQNESGKTSILEGLKAFHDGKIIEDMLRSDLSQPMVTCRFRFSISKLRSILDLSRIHPDVVKKIESLESVSLSRIWEEDLTSYLIIGDELMEHFQADEDKRKSRELKIEKLLEKTEEENKKALLAREKALKDLENSEKLLAEKQAQYSETRKNRLSIFAKSKKGIAGDDIGRSTEELEKAVNHRNEKRKALEEKEKQLTIIRNRQQLRNKIRSAQEEITTRKNDLVEARENLHKISTFAGLYHSDKEMRATEATREQYRLEMELAKDDLEGSRKDYDILLLATEHIYNGNSFEKAMKLAEEDHKKQEQFMGPRELGEGIFKCVPEFEMFEDFSSLLPNRIDLEDIITGNTSAEGYKAALNFLTITGLDYSFFQQPSSRILKQKIENLNGELTLNFQDFWRQNVGKNNKIKINFELGHYDNSTGEKSGKPFIEFWIKDESERLYPKQRSRGVRWFLSFFLELKATAMNTGTENKILLIDEPGVSLHARAQEDVLKVFDDIKQQIQILYSTHSPHLIDINKLYRVIAVQRAVEDDMGSETIVLDARSLKSATADTLSPVYAMMGARLNQQDIIKSQNNVVVKDLATYYFLKAILILSGYTKKECYFIPASGTSSMPMIINILIGWGLEYIALNFGNDDEKFMYNKLRKELFENNVDLAHKQLLFFREFQDVEDLFSTIDFKKYIVHVREGITVNNSEYLKDNNQSRAVMASNFLQSVNRNEISLKSLDEESTDNLKMLVEKLSSLLK